MLSTIPLDEIVELHIAYEVNTDTRTVVVRSPLSRSMTLAHAIRQAVSSENLGVRASITARGITYRDAAQFRRIWARRTFFQQSQ